MNRRRQESVIRDKDWRHFGYGISFNAVGGPLGTHDHAGICPDFRNRGFLAKVANGTLLLILFALSLLLITGCGSSSTDDGEPWPHGGLLDMVPVGSEICLDTFENSDNAYVEFEGDESRFKGYIDECSKMGFTVDTALDGDNYDAYNKDGYRVHIVCFDTYITLELDKPKTNSDLLWPSQGISTKIPNPNKEKGTVSIDDSETFHAYVGGVSKRDYVSYVDKCMKRGFNHDYSRSDKTFNAKDSQGDELYLRYEGFKTMYVDLTAVEKSDESSGKASSSNGGSSSENVTGSEVGGVAASSGSPQGDSGGGSAEESPKLKSLKATYNGSTKAGTKISNDSGIVVVAIYDDGTKSEVDGWELASEKTLKAGKTASVTISYEGKKTKLKIKCTTQSSSQFKASCESVPYKSIARNPGKYVSKKIKISGKVIQVMEMDDNKALFRVATKGNYDNVFLVSYVYGKKNNKILEDDRVTFWGYCKGTSTYESTMGSSITIPSMRAAYYTIS